MTQSPAFDPEWLSGHRQDEHAASIDRVGDPSDLKAPIRAEILEEDRIVVERAAHWFTDTVPIFTALPGASGRLEVRVRGQRPGSSDSHR